LLLTTISDTTYHLWTRDQHIAEIYIYHYNTQHSRQTNIMPPAGFDATIPVSCQVMASRRERQRRERKWQETGENYLLWSFMVCIGAASVV